MKIAFTVPFLNDYNGLSARLQEQADKQIDRLIENPNHPSLRAKKMEGHHSIWEARITKGYRMTFEIKNDTFLLRRIGTHDILKRP